MRSSLNVDEKRLGRKLEKYLNTETSENLVFRSSPSRATR